jgi:hypothetical protein
MVRRKKDLWEESRYGWGVEEKVGRREDCIVGEKTGCLGR